MATVVNKAVMEAKVEVIAAEVVATVAVGLIEFYILFPR